MKRREDTSQSATTRHAKGMTTGPLQIQPDIWREGPAGLTGPESTRIEDNQGGREGGGARRERAKPPDQTRKETTTTPKHRTAATKGRSPAAPRKKTTREAHRQRPTTTGTSKAGKRCTAERYGPKHTTQNNAKKNWEDEHTCPVCGQTHPRSMLKLEA